MSPRVSVDKAPCHLTSPPQHCWPQCCPISSLPGSKTQKITKSVLMQHTFHLFTKFFLGNTYVNINLSHFSHTQYILIFCWPLFNITCFANDTCEQTVQKANRHLYFSQYSNRINNATFKLLRYSGRFRNTFILHYLYMPYVYHMYKMLHNFKSFA